MARIYQRGNHWYVDIQRNKKRIRLKAGKNKRLAELFLKDIELKVERKQMGFLDRKEVDLETFVKDFLTYSQTNHRSSTTTRYRSATDNFMRFIRENTKIRRLSDVSTETIEQYKVWRKNVLVAPNGADPARVKPQYLKKGAKAYTINFEVMTVKTMLNLALKWKKLEVNPAQGIKKLKTEDSKKRRFLTEAECDQLLTATPSVLYPIFFLLIHTGMRKGELINLEWKDIDFHRGVIKVQRKSFWVPKTGERELPMSKKVEDVIRKLPRKSTLVFANENGQSLNPNTVRRQLIEVAKKAGILDLTEVHALRHTFASRLFMKGVDAPTVQKLMGHTKIDTTMIYTHQTHEHMREAMEKLT